ncbi:MAG: hypothetical protein ACXWA3_13065, partial [Acidimicrobiales bacterium]
MTDQSEQTHPSEQTQPSAQTQPAERADQVGDLAVVAEPEDLTPAWLTRALGSTGAFAVTAVE